MAIQLLGSHGKQIDRIDDRRTFSGRIFASNLLSGEAARLRSVWMALCCD